MSCCLSCGFLGSVVAAFVAIYYMLVPSRTRKRALSFNSENLVSGSFPPNVNCIQPIVNVFMLFDKCPSVDRLQHSVKKFCFYDRFASKIYEDPVTKKWVVERIKDESFMKKMVVCHEVSNEKELYEAMEAVMSQELDQLTELPLWRLHRFENIATTTNSSSKSLSAVIVRAHHVIGDGMSLVTSMTKMFNEDIKNEAAVISKVSGNSEDNSSSSSNTIEEYYTTPMKLDFLPKVNSGKPNTKRNSILKTIWQLVCATIEVLLLPLSAFDSNIVFTTQDKPKLTMTQRRKTLFFPSIRLEVIKAIKNVAGVTLNDVMMSVTAGAIERYCNHRDDALLMEKFIKEFTVDGSHNGNEDKELKVHSRIGKLLQNRALVPFAFPRPSVVADNPERALRNYWAFISIPLPIYTTIPPRNKEMGTADESTIALSSNTALASNLTSSQCRGILRLRECNRTTNILKSSPLAFIQLWIVTNLLPLLPKFFARQTAMDLFTRHTMVFSNVPGPTRILRFCDEKLLHIEAIFYNLLPQVIIVSYAGSVFMNMVVDPELISQHDVLESYFLEEIIDLCRAYKIDIKNVRQQAGTWVEDSKDGSNKQMENVIASKYPTLLNEMSKIVDAQLMLAPMSPEGVFGLIDFNSTATEYKHQ